MTFTCSYFFQFEKADLEEVEGSVSNLLTKTCQICRHEFQKKETSELVENTSMDIVVCDSCVYYIKPHTLLSEDENVNPDPTPKFLCDKCPKSFHNMYHLKRHLITHSDVRPFECKLCNQGFKRRDKLVSHFKRMHEGEPLDFSFLPNEEIENVDTSLIDKKCDRCGNNNGVVEIYLGDENSCINLCEVCNPSRLVEVNDNGVTEEEKLFSCEFCTKMFSRKDHATRHQLTHTSEKSFNCDFCDKSYTRKDKLLRHMLVHPEARPYLKHARRNGAVGDLKLQLPIFTCEFCGKKFKDKYTFEKHITVIHNQELSFPCHWCEEKFSSRELLKKHGETHRNGMTYRCFECDKVLLSSKSYRRHIDSHKTESPYKCETCSKSFKRKDKLKTHSLIHLDIRPYSCDLCHVAFKRKDKYFQHCKQLHTSNSDEEFMDLMQCDLCDESFACEDDLSEHKMTHY